MASSSKAKNGKTVTPSKRGPVEKAKVTKRPVGKSPKLSPARQDGSPTPESSTEDTGPVGTFPFFDLPGELQLQIIEIAAISPAILKVAQISRHYPAPIAERRSGTFRTVLGADIEKFYTQERRSEHRTVFTFAMTCRAVREAFSKIYYSRNTFHIPRPSDFGRFIRVLGEKSSYLKQIFIHINKEQPNWRQLAALPNLCRLDLISYPLRRPNFVYVPRSQAWAEDKFAQRVEQGLTYLLQHVGEQLTLGLVITRQCCSHSFFHEMAFDEMLERTGRHGVVARASEPYIGRIDIWFERDGA